MIKSYKNSHALALATILVGGIAYAVDPTFHLKNNSADAIQIDIMQNNKSLTGLKRVAKGGEFEFILDTSKPTTVDINYCPTAAYCKTNLPDKMIAKFKAGKTIYVKFDGKKVQPQKGNVLTAKTTAGYSSKNNVEKSDISIQEGKTAKSALGVGGMYKQETSQPAKPTPQATPQKPVKPSAPKPPKPANSQSSESLSGADLAWAQFPEALKIKRATTTKPDEFNKWNTYSAILGVDPKTGSTADFKKAYYKLSREWHPDKHPQNPTLASDVQALLNVAYKYLTD